MFCLLSTSVNQPAFQLSVEAQSEVAATQYLIQVAGIRSSLLKLQKGHFWCGSIHFDLLSRLEHSSITICHFLQLSSSTTAISTDS
jgi:hypothetical protein